MLLKSSNFFFFLGELLFEVFYFLVFFSEFASTSLNIVVMYWYHPADYWAFMEFNERVNMQIMEAFEKEGIEFAFPTTTNYLTQEDGQSLNVNLGGDSDPEARSD